MDYKQFITEITFSGINPLDPGAILLCGQAENPISTKIDLTITTLPLLDAHLREILGDLCTIPRMSTFAIGALINIIVSNLDDNDCFVNVGVWHGFSFLAGMANNGGKKCIGVDNFSQFGGPKEQFLTRFETLKSNKHAFYDMDYVKYFESIHSAPIGFYIYDGDHSKEHQRNGLLCAEPFLAKDALILVDDINAPGPMDGTVDFIQNSSHKYKVLIEQYTAHNLHPTFWNGIALIQKLT